MYSFSLLFLSGSSVFGQPAEQPTPFPISSMAIHNPDRCVYYSTILSSNYSQENAFLFLTKDKNQVGILELSRPPKEVMDITEHMKVNRFTYEFNISGAYAQFKNENVIKAFIILFAEEGLLHKEASYFSSSTKHKDILEIMELIHSMNILPGFRKQLIINILISYKNMEWPVLRVILKNRRGNRIWPSGDLEMLALLVNQIISNTAHSETSQISVAEKKEIIDEFFFFMKMLYPLENMSGEVCTMCLKILNLLDREDIADAPELYWMHIQTWLIRSMGYFGVDICKLLPNNVFILAKTSIFPFAISIERHIEGIYRTPKKTLDVYLEETLCNEFIEYKLDMLLLWTFLNKISPRLNCLSLAAYTFRIQDASSNPFQLRNEVFRYSAPCSSKPSCVTIVPSRCETEWAKLATKMGFSNLSNNLEIVGNAPAETDIDTIVSLQFKLWKVLVTSMNVYSWITVFKRYKKLPSLKLVFWNIVDPVPSDLIAALKGITIHGIKIASRPSSELSHESWKGLHKICMGNGVNDLEICNYTFSDRILNKISKLGLEVLCVTGTTARITEVSKKIQKKWDGHYLYTEPLANDILYIKFLRGPYRGIITREVKRSLRNKTLEVLNLNISSEMLYPSPILCVKKQNSNIILRRMYKRHAEGLLQVKRLSIAFDHLSETNSAILRNMKLEKLQLIIKEEFPETFLGSLKRDDPLFDSLTSLEIYYLHDIHNIISNSTMGVIKLLERRGCHIVFHDIKGRHRE